MSFKKNEIGYTISEDEIAYIAFHLGYALEIQKQRTNKNKLHDSSASLLQHEYSGDGKASEKFL